MTPAFALAAATGDDNATAPRVRRAPMHAQPWFGLARGLLFGLGRATDFPAAQPAQAAWQATATRRRRLLLAVIAALGALALALQWWTPPETLSPAWALQTTLVTLLFAWVGAGFVTALMGAWVMLRGDPHAIALRESQAPIDPGARTAIVMPICNESVATVFAGLRATCESLATTDSKSLFDIYVLSDTADPTLRAAELEAWQRLRQTLGDDPVLTGGRVFYRWRRRRTRRKAGNVADFCRRWGANYRYMVVLDADSIMHGDTLVSLVRLMEQNPRAGIVQTLPQGSSNGTVHARLQQFGSRVTGRLFSLGMAYWQLGESHYWGHNAILRMAPFMRHCALATLRGRGGLSGEILSHDFVEAALMRRAGFEVWLAPQLGGSWEQYPANLLEELQRDRRWCQGNLQNARLLAEPGLRPVHRAMLATGALSYLMAPVWWCVVVLGLWSGSVASSSSGLWLLTLLLLFLPRVLGVLTVLLRREQSGFGGGARLWVSASLELLLSAVQAPLRMLAHTVFVVGALTGLRLDWKSPSREAGAVSWREVLGRIGVLALPALTVVLVILALNGRSVDAPYLMPLLLPLLLVVPVTVWTSGPLLGRAARRAGLLSVPEERQPPHALRRGMQQGGFDDLVPASVQTTAGATSVAWRGPTSLILAIASLVLLPRTALTPELGPALTAGSTVVAQMSPVPVAKPRAGVRSAGSVSVTKPQLNQRHRPARSIDDAIRRRAFEAVAQSLEAENS